MYVKIRQDGALGIGRGTEGSAEITLGYGEAHMVAAALEKLAQTARSYKQEYLKTTDVGGGNKITFDRADDGTISISGDKNTYICTEPEIRELAEKLKHLPPVEVAPPSDYVKKITPSDGMCLVVTNGGNSIKLRLPEAAIVKTSIKSSIDSRFFDEIVTVGQRKIAVSRSSDLKWQLSGEGTNVRFTAYEIEALVAGLHNGILDVLMDVVKGFGADDVSDIRVKSQLKRVEQDATDIFGEDKNAKGLVRDITKRAKKIIGIDEFADERANKFIDMCNHVYANMNTEYIEPLFNLFSKVFVAQA
ncbi:MAG: hypothetical protein AM325_001900 [Candidatus Thorarchaeota archaeon SMTZ1-45]|nr:MAG: hypothetical protein AM325_03710 [Candidatus Thorarchaeota archaeon SMTZ1-45]